jgi:hypothetical protein
MTLSPEPASTPKPSSRTPSSRSLTCAAFLAPTTPACGSHTLASLALQIHTTLAAAVLEAR